MTVDLSAPNVQVSWVTLSHDDGDNIADDDDEYQNVADDEGIQVRSQAEAGRQLTKPLHSWDSSLFNYVCIKIRLFCLLYVQ